MRIVFMGTPEFAVPTLDKLINSEHEVSGIVTVPDKPAGRSRKMKASAVKSRALELGLPLLQPEDFSDPCFIPEFRKLEPDIAIVVAFRILPPEVFTIPAHGCVNLHASLLPDLRGAAPINWALIRGYKKTGLTTFRIEKGVDTGMLLMQREVKINNDDYYGSLSNKMSIAGAELVLETVDLLSTGSLSSRRQEGKVSKAPRIFKEDCRIDWSSSAEDVHNLVRGLSPIPCAHTGLNGRILKIYKTDVIRADCQGKPGTVVSNDEGNIVISCGKGCVRILELQLEGKKRINCVEFQRGKTIPVGTSLDS